MQCRQRLVCDGTAVIAEEPGPEFNNIRGREFVKLFGPIVGVDDSDTVLVVLERPLGDGLASVAALLLTNVQPLLEPLADAADFVGKADAFEALRCVLAV